MDSEFDQNAFFKAVDDRREAQGLTWRQLGRDLKLSPSTFSRLSRARKPDIETFLRLLVWLDMSAESFVKGLKKRSGPTADTLGAISKALRRDPSLTPSDVGPLEDIVRVAYRRFQSTGAEGRSGHDSGDYLD